MDMVTAMGQATSNRRRYVCQLIFWAVFWVWNIYGFLADDVFTPLSRSRSQLMWVLDMIMLGMACWVVRSRVHLSIVAVFLPLTWWVTCVLCHESVLFWVNGIRDFIGLLLVYPILLFIMEERHSREHFLASFDRQGLYLLLVHAFCIVVQFLLYGAGDLVGGGYGHYFSGQVSVTIYLVSFFLLRRRLNPDDFLHSLAQNKIYLILLLPTFLNETKVSFVLLILYFLLIAPIDRKLLVRILWMGPLLAVALWVGYGLYAYSTSVGHSSVQFETAEDVLRYFVMEDLELVEGDARWNMENNRGITDVPRFTKIAYLAVLNEQEPGHLLMGFGVGHFKGGTQLATSQFSRDYDWLLMGSVPYLFHVFIQMGLVGLLLLQLLVVIYAVDKPQWASGRDVNLQLMLLAVVFIVYLYNDMFRNLAFCMVFFALMSASWLVEPSREASA